MEFVYNSPFISIIFSMLTALAIVILRKGETAKKLTIVVQSVLLVLFLMLTLSFSGSPTSDVVYTMGKFPAPWGNELRFGIVEAMLALVFTLVMLMSVIGGDQDAKRDIDKSKLHLYYLMLNLTYCSLMALIFTNDIFTGYVFIEISTVAACSIVVFKENGKSIIASIKYLIMSIVGSGLVLVSISILYGITGHLLMKPAHAVIEQISKTGQYFYPLLMTFVFFSVAISIKSALFPFHSWLPDAHGSATSTSSAVLSGLVIKGYIVLFIKLVARVYGLDVVKSFGVMPIIGALGMVGMIAASILAIREKHIKRRLSYSTVAQVGYIFLGISFATVSGISAAIYHVMAHAITKSMLFLAVGSLIATAGSYQIKDLRGAGLKNKPAGIAFVIGGLSMIGFPLFAGFSAKAFLASAALDSGVGYLPIIIIIFSGFLNALYYVPVMMSLFSKNEAGEKTSVAVATKVSFSATFSLAVLATCHFVVALFSVQIIDMIKAGVEHLA